jgi:hypothetical protein
MSCQIVVQGMLTALRVSSSWRTEGAVQAVLNRTAKVIIHRFHFKPGIRFHTMGGSACELRIVEYGAAT